MYNNYWNLNQNTMYPNYRITYPYPSANNPFRQNDISSFNLNDQIVLSDIPSTSQKYFESISPYGDTRQPDPKRETIHLNAAKGNGVSLGDGFEYFRWDGYSIDSNEYLTAFLNAPELNVVSGGWAPQHYSPLYALESFPYSTSQWVITVFNPNSSIGPRNISFFLIAKRK